METPNGPEPCAVLACRGSGDGAAAAIARANAKLAEFQRISRWVLWPEPDLPRTSTGKVRRKPVAAWLARIQAAAAAPGGSAPERGGRRLRALLGLARSPDCADYGRESSRRGRRVAPERRSAPRQPGTRAAFRGHRRAAGHCGGQRAARRGADAGRAAQVGRWSGNKGTATRRSGLRDEGNKETRDIGTRDSESRDQEQGIGTGNREQNSGAPLRCPLRRASAMFIPSGRGGRRSIGFAWLSLKRFSGRLRGFWQRRAWSVRQSRCRRGLC